RKGKSMTEKITEFQKWAREHPIAGSLAAVLIMVVMTKPTSMLIRTVVQGPVQEILGSLVGIITAWLIVHLFSFRWICRHGSMKETVIAGLPQLLFYSFLMVLFVMNTIVNPDLHWAEPAWILAGLLRLFQIGFLEESVFRGVISNLLGFRYGKDTKGIWTAVLFSSAAFGLTHLTNILNGVTLLNAVLQSVVAFIMGIYLCAVYYRGRSIWAMMLIHAVTDSLGLFPIYFQAGGSGIDQAAVINTMSIYPLPRVPRVTCGSVAGESAIF
ncbi:MAG: CPBP family intramembrane metalloprotease, partial [Solobacterium sp.]|nr:CPBP family intramembrane metalloprotease [Solobacterium sp.]